MIVKSSKVLSITLSLALLPSVVFALEDPPKDTLITLTLDDAPKYYLTKSDVSQFLERTTKLIYDPSYKIELEKDVLCLDTEEPCLLTSSIRDSFTVRSTTTQALNETKLKATVEDVARRLDVSPTNAKLTFDDETGEIKELTPHEDGLAINIDETTEKIAYYINNNTPNKNTTIEMVHEKSFANITKDNANELGIKEVIGEGTSNFSGSTNSRIHNIKTAAKRFDGLVIEPDEEFSFVSVLGPVDGEHGYKEELVIRDNETKPEYGGGICQVSTTVFRGAIYTGMEITQRRNHSYPVHYYTPIGFDATVYLPAPDFRFVNNTPGHILLKMEMEGNNLRFKYYGTNDGRQVEMDGPHITDRQPNGAMKTYFTQKVTDKDGEIVIDDIFKSNYKSPDDYPNPNDVAKLTEKPDNWSKSQWKDYKAQHGL